MYRPLWSEQILGEMGKAMETNLHRTAEEIEHRRREMKSAFPEAMVSFPRELIRAVECIPDENDRHVLAAAVMARANTIVTQNVKHFPKSCLEKYNVLCQTADDFLLHQYHLCPQMVLDKIDDAGAGIGHDRDYVINSLRRFAPAFCSLVEEHTL